MRCCDGFSKLAQNEVRSDIFGRYGGEEFLLIFTQSSLHGAYSTLQRFGWRWKILHLKTRPDLRVTVSIVTVYQRPANHCWNCFSRRQCHVCGQAGWAQPSCRGPAADRTGERPNVVAQNGLDSKLG